MSLCSHSMPAAMHCHASGASMLASLASQQSSLEAYVTHDQASYCRVSVHASARLE